MSINRTNILKGPALIQYDGQTFWSKGDVALNFQPQTFPVQTSHFGEVDLRISDKTYEVSFEPSGRFTAGLAAVLWPYATLAIGSSIFGASDKPLVIWSRDGKKLTLANAALTGMPNIRQSVSKTVQGPLKFTGILKNSTDPSAAGAYYTLETASYPGDSGFAVSDIPTKAYASAWGASPWDAFHTEDGWEISFGLTIRPQKVDGHGTVDMTLQGLTVSAKCIPVGPAESDILAKAMPATDLGSSIAAAAANLNISATGVYVRIYNAGIVNSGFVYGSERKRIGATEWRATRTITAGSADPLFYIGTSSPA